MKTLGLIGGMSWESTVPYYRLINEAVKARLGGLHSAKILLWSVDFAEFESLMRANRWADVGVKLAAAAKVLQRGGAEALVLCTNTLHKLGPAIENAVSIPLLQIVDPTADAVKRAGLSTIGLLATRYTMEEEFYVGRLQQQHGLAVIVPDATDRAVANRIIFDELCRGKVLNSSRQESREMIGRLVARGAQGIVLGCTELSMLIAPADSAVPLFDTTALHAAAAAAWALG
ncbi:MAG: aspartate/glutamate racemase family protein [Steroidobacteraceae bacterium]